MKNLKYIWLNGMPRSGTSWLSQIFDSHPNVKFKLSPLFSYAFKNAMNINSTRQEWIDFFHKVYKTEDIFMDQEYRRKKGEYPIFKEKYKNPKYIVIKDTRYHNLTERIIEILPEVKFIHIVRHPCGAINSWLRAPREFPKDANPLKEWKTGDCRKTGSEEFWGFNDWKNFTMMYLELMEQFPARVLVIHYEQLVDNSLKITKKMFDFVGLEMNPQTAKFLKNSQASHIYNEYAVFKNKNVKYKWKRQLNPKIISEIYSVLKGTPLEKFLND